MNARSPICLVVLLCLAALPSQAQLVGLRGGLSLSTLHGDESALTHIPEDQEDNIEFYSGDVGQRRGVHVAGTVTMFLTDWLALQSELQYIQKGATIHVERYESCRDPQIYCIPTFLERRHLSYRLSYLQLPMLLKARIPVGFIAVSLLVGPSVGLNLGAELAVKSFDVVGLPSVAAPESHSQVGLIGGLEISYRLGRAGTLLLDARIHPSLTEIPLERTEASVRSPAAEISLGWTLPWDHGE